MKTFLKYAGVFVVFLLIFKISYVTSEKYPVVYYYSTDKDSITYILNEDKTCRIIHKLKNGLTSDDTFYTSWETYSHQLYVIERESGKHEIIKDGYLYDSFRNADVKQNGLKLRKKNKYNKRIHWLHPFILM